MESGTRENSEVRIQKLEVRMQNWARAIAPFLFETGSEKVKATGIQKSEVRMQNVSVEGG